MKLLVILISVAVLALSSATALPTTELPTEKVTSLPVTDVQDVGELSKDENIIEPEIVDEDEENIIDPDIVDEETTEEENIIEPEMVYDENYDEEIVYEENDDEEDIEDGVTDEDDDESDDDKESEKIDFDLLTEEEIRGILDAEEEIFTGELDMYLGTSALLKIYQNKVSRQKRWVPLAIAGGRIAFAAGRAFLSRYARNGITRSGSRITKHYSKPGNYFTGLREFKRLNPTNVKKIGGSKFNGWTGTSGNYRVTVRSGSKGTSGSNGSPTLSVSSKNGDLIRKFRYD